MGRAYRFRWNPERPYQCRPPGAGGADDDAFYSGAVVLIDRGYRWGGHWADQYAFCKLHQPYKMYTAGEREWSITKGVGVLYTKETSVVLGSGVKSNSIPPVTYLQRSINSEKLFSIFYNRSLLSVVVIYKFFRIFLVVKC